MSKKILQLFNTDYHKTGTNLELVVGRYNKYGNHVSIKALDVSGYYTEPFASITANIPELAKYPYNFCCLNTGEAGAAIENLITESGIGSFTGECIHNGKIYPLYIIDLHVLSEYDVSGVTALIEYAKTNIFKEQTNENEMKCFNEEE